MNQTDFPSRVRDERKRRGWTQSDLAEAAHVSLRMVQNFEGRKGSPQPGNLAAILGALDIDPEGDDIAAQTRSEWPAEVQVFLDMLGAYLMSLPEPVRLDAIRSITRQIFAG